MLLLALVLSIPSVVRAEWTPPAKPSPRVILQEARANVQDGDYADALLQFEWIFDHSLEVQPSFAGVRLSSGLREWLELALEYEPALDSLKERRTQRRSAVLEAIESRKKENVYDNFHDLRRLNDTLAIETDTLAMFREMAQEAPELARYCYPLVQDLLIEAKEFALCGQFIDPLRSYAQQLQIYSAMKEEEGPPELQEKIAMRAEAALLSGASELIAVLVNSNRSVEATVLAEHLSTKSQHPKSEVIIAAALQGTFPPHWMELE